MTPEEQRVAIAEWMGWRVGKNPNGEGIKWVGPNGESKNGGGLYGWGYGNHLYDSDLPDFLNDLNAIHEAEKIMFKKQCQEYLGNLWKIVNYRLVIGVIHPQNEFSRNMVHATAAQRCEALLKTLSLWKDSHA